jgi:hypothetical protein
MKITFRFTLLIIVLLLLLGIIRLVHADSASLVFLPFVQSNKTVESIEIISMEDESGNSLLQDDTNISHMTPVIVYAHESSDLWKTAQTVKITDNSGNTKVYQFMSTYLANNGYDENFVSIYSNNMLVFYSLDYRTQKITVRLYQN